MKNTFEINSWDEKPYLELENGAKYSRATIKKQYKGVLNGSGYLEYVMAYHSDGSASFVGLEYFDGIVGGKQGSMTLEHKGTFQNGVAESEFYLLADSCSEGLAGLSAKGRYTTGHSMTVEFELECSVN